MTEMVITQLLALQAGLNIRVALLDESTARFFKKDQEKLERLIESLLPKQREE